MTQAERTLKVENAVSKVRNDLKIYGENHERYRKGMKRLPLPPKELLNKYIEASSQTFGVPPANILTVLRI